MNYNVWFRWIHCFIYTYRTLLLSAMIFTNLIRLLSISCFLFLFPKFLVYTWIHLLPTHRSVLKRCKSYKTTISIFGLLYHLPPPNFHLIWCSWIRVSWYNLYRKSDKMQQCIKVLLFRIYMKLNMFRATHRPSSGAKNYTSSLWFYIRGRLLDV